MNDLRTAAQQALDEWRTDPGSVRMASLMMALEAALADGDKVAPTGCDHCNHPLYAAIKCKNCGRVNE